MNQYRTDILIHIGENLDDSNIHQLEKQISFEPGIYSACINEKARHLMLVDYDPMEVKAKTLLGALTSRGLHAEMVGF